MGLNPLACVSVGGERNRKHPPETVRDQGAPPLAHTLPPARKPAAGEP